MAMSPVKRRLAAILSIDVVSYSAMMGADEEGTLRLLRATRDVVDVTIARRDGRIANTAGDSVLAEFGSPVEAVRAAVEIQIALGERNAALPPERRMTIRAGVHLDDVIVQDNGDLIGEGVNIAARLQSAAEVGGVAVSGDIVAQARAKLPDYGFEPMRDSVFKNIVRNVEGYRVAWGAAGREVSRSSVSASSGVREKGAPQARGSKTVVAVLAGLLLGAAIAGGGWFLLRDTGPTPEERAAWATARESQRSVDVETFLGRFPSGALAPEARTRLAALRAAETEAKRLADERLSQRTQAALAAEKARRDEEAAQRVAAQREAAAARDARIAASRKLTWQDIDCAQSRLQQLPGMKCERSDPYDGIDGKGRFQRWAASVQSASVSTRVVLIHAADPRSALDSLRFDDEDEMLTEISTFTRINARDWSPLRSMGSTVYATFKAPDGRNCVAFSRPGAVRGLGLEWIMRAYYCPAGREPIGHAEAVAAAGFWKVR